MLMNRKAKEEWEKKQAEAEKLRKVNEVSVTLQFMNYVSRSQAIDRT